MTLGVISVTKQIQASQMPNIYILDEKQFLEGNCKVCGNKQTTEVVVTYLNS